MLRFSHPACRVSATLTRVPSLPVPEFVQKKLARQLGGPSGAFGELVARGLNKGNAKAIRAAVDVLELSGGKSVADIGFGGGLGLDLLLAATAPDGTVHGVEPAASMVARASRHHRSDIEHGRLIVHQATMDALPFADRSIDGVITLNTIYFMEDLSAALAELRRVLADDGRGVIGIGDPERMRSHISVTRHGFNLRSTDDVQESLRAAGFSVEHQVLNGAGPAGIFHLLTVRHEA